MDIYNYYLTIKWEVIISLFLVSMFILSTSCASDSDSASMISTDKVSSQDVQSENTYKNIGEKEIADFLASENFSICLDAAINNGDIYETGLDLSNSYAGTPYFHSIYKNDVCTENYTRCYIPIVCDNVITCFINFFCRRKRRIYIRSFPKLC